MFIKKKRNHRYHSRLVQLALATFPDEDPRQVRKFMWRIRTNLRDMFPFPKYLVGCQCTIVNNKPIASSEFVDFDDFLNRYFNILPPFFMMDNEGLSYPSKVKLLQ